MYIMKYTYSKFVSLWYQTCMCILTSVPSQQPTQKHAVKRLNTSKPNFCNLPVPTLNNTNKAAKQISLRWPMYEILCFLMYCNIICTISTMFFLNPSMVTSVNWTDLHYIHKLLALVHCMVMNTFNETVNLNPSVAGNSQNLKPTTTEELKTKS